MKNEGSPADRPADVLLLHAHRDHFGAVSEDISIGLNLLTVFLRDRGHVATMARGTAGETVRTLETLMAGPGARSVGFYCDYENVSLVADLARLVKTRWGVPVFIGGPQAVGLTADFLRASRCDAVVRGEGEFPLLELLETYLTGHGSRETIAGLTFLGDDGTVIRTPDRPPLDDLDALPAPDFRLDRGSDSWNLLPIITGRGCPYRCAFCYEGGNTKKVRMRSVECVVREITTHFERHPQVRYLFFVDDTFTLNPDRVLHFCREFTRLRRDRDFVWFCEGHVQTIANWPHMLPAMAEAGCVKIFLGIESGADEVLTLYRKRTTAAMVEQVVADCLRAGIPQVAGNIILGGPRETPETIEAGWRLIERLLRLAPGRFDSLAFFLIPYPNTAIRNDPGAFGLRLREDRVPHCLEDMPLTETEALSWEDLFRWRAEFNRRILKLMHEIYVSGGIDHAAMLDIFRMNARYGVTSRWFQIYERFPFRQRFYRELAAERVRRLADIPLESRGSWVPQRMFELWQAVDTSEGYPCLGSHVLSPLEWRLLQLCSGKLPLEQVLERVVAEFGASRPTAQDQDQAAGFALEVLERFEGRCWIAYAPF
jgi:anaerobic magnesium-protoporphyrin IX monomethyl ester cyclase